MTLPNFGPKSLKKEWDFDVDFGTGAILIGSTIYVAAENLDVLSGAKLEVIVNEKLLHTFSWHAGQSGPQGKIIYIPFVREYSIADGQNRVVLVWSTSAFHPQEATCNVRVARLTLDIRHPVNQKPIEGKVGVKEHGLVMSYLKNLGDTAKYIICLLYTSPSPRD